MRQPVLVWGDAFDRILYPRWPVDNTNAGTEPRAGWETSQAPSGVEDAWDAGEDQILEVELRWLPVTNRVDLLLGYEPGDPLTGATFTRASTATFTQETMPTPRYATWDGALGVREFLRHAAIGRKPVRVYPDLASYFAGVGMIESTVIEPTRAMADSTEADGSKRVRLKLRNPSTAYEGY